MSSPENWKCTQVCVGNGNSNLGMAWQNKEHSIPLAYHHGKLKQTKQPITDCGALQVVPKKRKRKIT